ncbi:hypothetical protein ZEAMMB73_Zm00001d045248 [Zea mays]|uniref:Uncharacterized protein n=1 Tax=Zea mays TaxID=4577 RepID=A0A1D6NUS4_MAIZE|nr:hypothetical protein ZEAMMB73_Zm00001d045248 [Zea mays]
MCLTCIPIHHLMVVLGPISCRKQCNIKHVGHTLYKKHHIKETGPFEQGMVQGCITGISSRPQVSYLL